MSTDRLYSNIYPNYALLHKNLKGKKRLLKGWLPMHLVMPLSAELQILKLKLHRQKTIRRFQHTKDLKVNIGAGASGLDGWVNVDMFPMENVNCVFDCRKSLPFPNESVRLIFTEHFFEHLDYTEEVPFFLHECYRVMRPGAIIRIIVPDYEQYIRAYVLEGWEELMRVHQMGENLVDPYFTCQYHTKLELLNLVARQGWEHKFFYDFETLSYNLHKHGFRNIQRLEYGITSHEELAIDKPQRAIGSLYVEAEK